MPRASRTPAGPPASQERVGCLRGIQWCNRYLDSRRIVWFNDEKQGLALLKRGRTDWVIRLLPTNQFPLATPWKRVSDIEVYLYLNKSRQADIAALVQSQQQLIASGRWQQMQERYFSALLTPIRCSGHHRTNRQKPCFVQSFFANKN